MSILAQSGFLIDVDLKPMRPGTVQLKVFCGFGSVDRGRHCVGKLHVSVRIADLLISAWRAAGIPVSVTGNYYQARAARPAAS